MNQPYLVAFGGWTCEVHIQYHVMEEKGVETGEDLPANEHIRSEGSK